MKTCENAAMSKNIRHRHIVLMGAVPVIGLLCIAGCAAQRTVLVTGFWPPTNEMLRGFSEDAAANPSGWRGKNWQNSGYDVVAYFPEFPNGTAAQPSGQGDFQVDYQDARADFERLTKKLNPAMILCYGRGDGPWEIETQAVFHTSWNNDYRPPQQPDWPRHFDYPAGSTLALTVPAEAIERAVKANVPGLNVWIDRQGNPGAFICGYLAFLAADYQMRHPAHCKAAGFIHVAGDVDLQTAQKAHEATLAAMIEAMNQ
jgi:pyrrolidone-carboxylate peptidase